MSIRTDQKPSYTIICDRCKREESGVASWNPPGWPPTLSVYGEREEPGYECPVLWDGQLCTDCTKAVVNFLQHRKEDD